MAATPPVLLLDEPCAGLSGAETELMADLIRDYQREMGGLTVVVEHDMSLVEAISDLVLVMHQGRVLALDTFEAIRNRPDVRAVYAGGTKMTALLEMSGLTGGYLDTHVLFDVSARIEAGHRSGGARPERGWQDHAVPSWCREFCPCLEVTFDWMTDLSVGWLFMNEEPWGSDAWPQTAMVFDDLTVRENLELGRNREAPDRYFDRFPVLAQRLDQAAGTMSGGERKLLAFVRTMIENTRLIVLERAVGRRSAREHRTHDRMPSGTGCRWGWRVAVRAESGCSGQRL